MSNNRWQYILKIGFFVVALLSGCVGNDQIPTTAPAEIEVTQSPQTEISEKLVRPADGMTMVSIPGSTFQMGSTQAEVEEAIELCQAHYQTCNRWYYEREHPTHSVSLDSYWIDQTEISNEQYQLCVDSGECAAPLTCIKGEPTYSDPSKANHPVVCVNWSEAHNYCQWAGVRLPTEAEWEFAYRGEKRAIFSWGNDFDGTRLNYCDKNCGETHSDDRYDDSFSHTAPAGSFPSGISWSGVYNMSGNVSEWVADWFGEYSPETVSNPVGPSTGNQKMIKGCSWFFHPTYCRGATRPAVNLDTRFDYLGFRCAASQVNGE